MRPNVEYYEQELEKLRAKLAIAVKALQHYATNNITGGDHAAHIERTIEESRCAYARATLQELGKDDL